MPAPKRLRSTVLPMLGLAALVTLVMNTPAFLPGHSSPNHGRSALLSSGAVSVLSMPMVASAEDGLPEPVLGVGMLSVTVVIVLLISSIAIGRGLVETIDDL